MRSSFLFTTPERTRSCGPWKTNVRDSRLNPLREPSQSQLKKVEEKKEPDEEGLMINGL